MKYVAKKIKASSQSALEHAVSADRFTVFNDVAGGDSALACQLYLWDRDLAAAILRDVAIVEVALRNALATRLAAELGQDWFDGTDLRADRRLNGAISRAKDELTRANKQITASRVTAAVSLGFWVNLLDARPSESLWRRTLYRAFPGGRSGAASAGQRFTRTWTLQQLLVMRYVRNRCAHHEPLTHGVPLPGQAQRVTISDAITTYQRITRMIDRDLADWMVKDSIANDVLSGKPGHGKRTKYR